MVGRRVLGLAAVSMILSSLIVASIARERVAEPVEVLKNEFPEVSQPGSGAFSFSVVFRRSVEEAQLRFYALYSAVYPAVELVDPDRVFNETSSPKDMIMNVKAFKWFSEKASAIGLLPEDVEANVKIGGEEYKLLLHDYSRVLEAVCGNETTASVSPVFGCVMNRSGAGYYLVGDPGFFRAANATLLGLAISAGGAEHRYVPDDQVKGGSGELPLSQAPSGVLTFRKVEKDDVVNVVFSVRGGALPRPMKTPIAMVQMVEIYVDAKIMGEPILNIIKSGGWRA